MLTAGAFIGGLLIGWCLAALCATSAAAERALELRELIAKAEDDSAQIRELYRQLDAAKNLVLTLPVCECERARRDVAEVTS